MSALSARTDALLHSALKVFEQDGEAALHAALEALPAPIYVTDADGVVTFFNSACIGFTGRQPQVGKDRWCVTWKLYTEAGAFLPHEQCPMAVALSSGRPVRGVRAVAERPDGTRVTFQPFPTPILDATGAVAGAVNLLLDVTEVRQAADLRAQAQQARRLARSASDPTTIDALKSMAEEYEAKASDLETRLH
ncbi:PAS domain-containing protein [Brevundimonas sp.]|uniref:PAS domain-containing protein n=1 Tax=Brevundimonas sp. TaxID=1871086 RepID=UPI002D672437|nr:PAS domain-containing protein [Brevundimonas sp.]HYC73458.1 PAS domain-containing protein [Brevundimonas sp.]